MGASERIAAASERVRSQHRLSWAGIVLGACASGGLSYIYFAEAQAVGDIVAGALGVLTLVGLLALSYWHLERSASAVAQARAWQILVEEPDSESVRLLLDPYGFVAITPWGLVTELGSFCSIRNLVDAEWREEDEKHTDVWFKGGTVTRYVRRSLRIPAPLEEAKAAFHAVVSAGRE